MLRAKKVAKVPIGALVHFTTVSAASFSLYADIAKKRLRPLDFVCPCHVRSDDALEVMSYIGKAAVLLQIKRSKKTTVGMLEDLQQIF